MFVFDPSTRGVIGVLRVVWFGINGVVPKPTPFLGNEKDELFVLF